MVGNEIKNNIEELTLLLLYLTAWDEEGFSYDEHDMLEKVKFKHSWKGYSFDALNNLTDKEYLYPCKNKNKSVTLTKQGIELAETLMEKYKINKD